MRLLWLVGALAWSAGLPARAETVRFGEMTLDLPPGFERKVAHDGVLLRRDLPRKDRPDAKPGLAMILVKAAEPATRSFDDAFEAFAAPEQLRYERSPLKGQGVTVNGHRIRWERRCCGRNGPRILAWSVGIATPTSHHFLQLLTVGAASDDNGPLQATFETLVRSLRPSAADRAFTLEPAGDGGLDGLYSHLDTGLRLNPFGGMEFYSEQDTMLFDPSGLYSENLPHDGDLAASCREKPVRCGTYRVKGDQISLVQVVDGFGTLHDGSKRFTRSADGIAIEGRDYRLIPPVPGPVEGTWNASFAQTGSLATGSTSVYSSRSLTLTRDGRFTRTGSYGFSTSNSIGDSTTGVSGGGRRAAATGRYTIAGYTLTLTMDDGRIETLSLFAPDVGSDGLLVINGGNYLKAKSGGKQAAPR